MIENFDAIKKQLKELAVVINSFESEAVQLRIIDLILGGKTGFFEKKDLQNKAISTPKKQKPKKKQASKEKGQAAVSKKKAPAGTGAVATITQLSETDFFNGPRTINDIIQHCNTNLARRFKAGDMSGKLARMVRNGELTREKNADGQYEYKKA